MTTSVPDISFTPTGPVLPTEAAILAGVLADLNSAFGGNLNITNLTTPQGQIAQSETAIIGDKNNDIAYVLSQFDPSTAEGIYQDAIGYLYFMTRLPATATTLTITCAGGVGVVIGQGATVQDSLGNLYACTAAVTIPVGGTVTATFACTTLGPVAIPASVTISQTIAQWDSATIVSGVEGTAVESQTAFEYRRQQTVAANSVGMLNSVLGNVWNTVPGVVDVYGLENPTSTQIGASITGSISGTTLTVASVASGAVAIGDIVTGTGVAQGCVITAGSGSTWTVNQTYTTAVPATGTETMTCAPGGQILVPNSIYVGVYGGNSALIAAAIYAKRMPGSNYNGNTSVVVTDPGPAINPYAPPLPQYTVTYQSMATLAIAWQVTLRNNSLIPSNYAGLIQAAILAAFSGTDGGQRARSGMLLLASRFVGGIINLGAWAQVESLLLGTVPTDVIGTTRSSIQIGVNQTPIYVASNVTVILSST